MQLRDLSFKGCGFKGWVSRGGVESRWGFRPDSKTCKITGLSRFRAQSQGRPLCVPQGVCQWFEGEAMDFSRVCVFEKGFQGSWVGA